MAEINKQARYCTGCKKEIFPNYRCSCVGGGKEENDPSKENTQKNDSDATSRKSNQTVDTTNQLGDDTTETKHNTHFTRPLQVTHTFNPVVISNFLSNRALLIHNKNEMATLHIELRVRPHLQDQQNELKKFTDAILNALRKFKKDNNILTNCATIEKDSEGHIISLRIHLPTRDLYNAFIKRLANQHLLPVQTIEQPKKIVYTEGVNHFNPSVLLKLNPSSNKKVKFINDEDAEEQNRLQEKKRSSIRPRSPRDGLTLKRR